MSNETTPVRAFCAFCGQPMIAPNARFCSSCGKEQVASTAMNQEIRVAVGNDVPTVKISVGKPKAKGRAPQILALIFACLFFIDLILIQFIKFKLDKVGILFFHGAKRTAIDHDLPLYYLWFAGFIVATILIIVTIILLVVSFKTADKKAIGLIALGILLFGGIILFLPTATQVSDKVEDYQAVKELDGKPAYEGFVSYDK